MFKESKQKNTPNALPAKAGSLSRKDESRQDETRFAQTIVLLLGFNPFDFGFGKWDFETGQATFSGYKVTLATVSRNHLRQAP